MLQLRDPRWLAALKHEIRYGPLARFKSARDRRAKLRALRSWMDALRTDPPQVLLGANISRHNGIRHHMEGIKAHSSFRVELSPPDELLEALSYHDLHTTFRDEVMSFVPKGVSVVHSHVYPYFIKWCRRHRNAGPLWVHTYHLPYFPVDTGNPLLPWQKEINQALVEDARHAHIRISVSKWQQGYYREHHGIETVYLPNGVDVAWCERAEPERFVERTGIRDFVLFVGRDEPVKNPREFVELAASIPDRTFVMIGPGLDQSSVAANWRTNVPRNLVLLGSASRSEVQDALAACAALVVTSKREGLPTLVLEAMVHERPIVVSNDAGCVEAIDQGRFGQIYTLGDIDDLAEKTRRALSSKEGAPGAGAWVRSEYDWRMVARKLGDFYSRGAV